MVRREDREVASPVRSDTCVELLGALAAGPGRRAIHDRLEPRGPLLRLWGGPASVALLDDRVSLGIDERGTPLELVESDATPG